MATPIFLPPITPTSSFEVLRASVAALLPPPPACATRAANPRPLGIRRCRSGPVTLLSPTQSSLACLPTDCGGNKWGPPRVASDGAASRCWAPYAVRCSVGTRLEVRRWRSSVVGAGYEPFERATDAISESGGRRVSRAIPKAISHRRGSRTGAEA